MRMPRHSRNFWRSVKKYRATIIIIVVLTGLTAGSLWWYLDTQNKAHDRAVAAHAESLATLDKELEAIKARKAEEARLRKLAEAKKTAQDVLKTSESNAGKIDAKKCNVSGTHTDPTSPEVMVNKKHCIQPLTYAPSDLVTAHGATLSAKAMTQFKAMYSAAAAAGQSFSVTSSYRSYSNQVTTYNYWVGVSGAAGADTYSARPGYSEHQTGFALDVANASGSCSLDCFGSTSQYKWLQANAATYGFIQRYYAGYESITGYTAEEWHYRYVGVAVAQDMKQKGIKTLEQYWGLPGGTY